MSDTLLWTYEDIAAECKYSARYVRDKIMKDPDAPAPVFPGRYRPADVRQFLNVVQARKRSDCNRPSRASDLSTRTSGTDQEH